MSEERYGAAPRAAAHGRVASRSRARSDVGDPVSGIGVPGSGGGEAPEEGRGVRAAGVARPDRGTPVAAAIVAARVAQPVWASLPVHRRLAPVAALRAGLGRRGHQLAGLTGRVDRPGWVARTEALSAEVVPLADACAFLEGEAEEILAPRRPSTDSRPAWLAGVELEVYREAFGVVLVVAPSNYPILLPGVQALQALVAGNAVLLKPGPRGTTAACWLADRLADGGLPPGLLTVLPESPSAVHEALATGVDKVVFTGSAETGAALLGELAPRLVPAAMELSGCDPLVALEGADPDLVARALGFGLRLNGGATCIAPRRAYVHRSLYGAVEAGVVRAAAELAADLAQARSAAGGRPVEPEEHRRARRLAAEAVAAGARLVFGELPEAEDPAAGTPALASGPLVVADPPPGCELERADLFAPVLTLVAVDDADAAVRRANAAPYALGASVFGPEVPARSVAARLDAGVVTVNDVIVPTADPRLPFGGRRRSGFGVTRGAEGLLEMTTPKAVSVRHSSRTAGDGRHLETPRPSDEALFRSYLALAHGGSFAARLGAVPSLLRALWGRWRDERRHRTTPRREADASGTTRRRNTDA